MPKPKPASSKFVGTLAQLRDEKHKLTSTAIAVLSGATKHDLADFAKTWVTLSVARRREIARRMVDLAEADFKLDFDVLFQHMLNDDDAQVRVAGIEGLWEAEDSALVKPLIGFLRSDPDAGVRAAAADALGRFVLLGEYEQLDDALREKIGEALLATTRSDLEDLSVRCRAVEALAYWSNDIVREVIEIAYEDDTPEMRASAVAAMGHTADSFWRKIVEAELESPDPRMRFEAARATGELENRGATARLIQLLDDDDREVQGAAIVALGQVGGKAARDALTQAAQSDDEVLCELANDALEELQFAADSDLLLLDIDRDDEPSINGDEEEE
jgi:HEAT repeat protein